MAHNNQAADREVPLILIGKPPDASELHTSVASNDFTKLPRAFIVGGGYDEEDFKRLYDTCLETCGGKEKMPPVLRISRAMALQGPEKPGTPGYSLSAAKRLKEKLKDLSIAPGLEEMEKTGDRGEVFLC